MPDYLESTPFSDSVAAELYRARQNYPQPINSLHEGLAVLLEEVEEVKAVVFARNRSPGALVAVRGELVQVAAVARRIVEDVVDPAVMEVKAKIALAQTDKPGGPP